MSLTEQWNSIVRNNAGLTEIEFVRAEFESFLYSQKRSTIIQSRKYYEGKHNTPKHLIPDENGNATDATGTIPNHKIINNLFDDLVDQKTNNLISKPLDVKCN